MVEISGTNQSLFHRINDLSLRTGPWVWANVTIVGDGLVCAVLLLPWIRRHPERVWGGLVGALVMVVVLRVLKNVLDVPRPLGVLPAEAVHVIGPGHRKSAFPSGHSATIFLFFGTWALSESRRWLRPVLVLPAILVGVSRIVVGVHWPADVLGGAALGWISAWIGLRMAWKAPWGTGKKARVILGALLLLSALALLFVDHTGYPGVLIFQRGIALIAMAWGSREMYWILRSP
jgi:membrane-associated phospholipid phosphatase